MDIEQYKKVIHTFRSLRDTNFLSFRDFLALIEGSLTSFITIPAITLATSG